MDLALGLAPPVRRNSKMELPLSAYRSKSFDDSMSAYRSKSFDNSMSIHIPMESDSSSIFAPSGSCRIARWLMAPQYDAPNCNYMQKSAQFGKSGTAITKMILPKGPLAISISRQTAIVGGFVGSKTHAGRSMFGDSSQIWDALMCKFVELMSLVKEKPTSAAPKSKLPSMHNGKYVPGIDDSTSKLESSNENVCSPRIVSCSSSKKCVLRNCTVSHITDTTNRIPVNISPTECKAVVPEPEVPPLKSSTDIFPHRKGTYSSVVDGTFKAECASNGSCTMVKLNGEQPQEGSRTGLQRVPLQSYADVAKIIPCKPMSRPSKSSCEIKQNLKNMWSNRVKRSKITHDKRVVNCLGNNNRNVAVDDFVSSRDTRWKGDWKSKREKFQRRCPVTPPSNVQSSTSSETSEENSLKDNFTKDVSNPVEECKWTTDDKEPVRPGCSKEGLRGRHPSECSLDSEDSFVIFEDCPDTTWTLYSGTTTEINPSEESDSEDDDSCSSSGSSDSEDDDDYVDSGERRVKFQCLPSNSSVKEDCTLISKCCAQTVPEKSKGVKKKTVHFAEGSHLAVVRPMIAWGYAYRESRRGPWEVHARDRARFHCRIASLAPILNAVLDPLHRRKVMASRLHDL